MFFVWSSPRYRLTQMTFKPALLHPNIYANGEVCISILHAPGDDPNMYESASERWSPVQSVEKILLSVISMLAEPNVESGANIECCVGSHLVRPNAGQLTMVCVHRNCIGTTEKNTSEGCVNS